MIAKFDNIEPLRDADIKRVEASEKGLNSSVTFEKQASAPENVRSFGNASAAFLCHIHTHKRLTPRRSQ